jgi:hypothetical protein
MVLLFLGPASTLDMAFWKGPNLMVGATLARHFSRSLSAEGNLPDGPEVNP